MKDRREFWKTVVVIAVMLFLTVTVVVLLSFAETIIKINRDRVNYPIQTIKKNTKPLNPPPVHVPLLSDERLLPDKPDASKKHRRKKKRSTIESLKRFETGVVGPDKYRVKVFDSETGYPLSGFYMIPVIHSRFIELGDMYPVDPDRRRKRRAEQMSILERYALYSSSLKPFHSGEFTLLTGSLLHKKFYTVILVEGYEPFRLELGISEENANIQDVKELTVEMRRGTTIEGRVVTKEDEGVPFVTMYFQQKEPFEFLRIIFANDEGYFKLTEVPKESIYTIKYEYTLPTGDEELDRRYDESLRASGGIVIEYKPDGKFLKLILLPPPRK